MIEAAKLWNLESKPSYRDPYSSHVRETSKKTRRTCPLPFACLLLLELLRADQFKCTGERHQLGTAEARGGGESTGSPSNVSCGLIM